MSTHTPFTPQLVLDTLLQSRVPVAVFAWRNEPGWPLEYVSPNVELVIGYNALDFSERGVHYAQIIHPDDLERVFFEVQHYSESGVSVFEHEDYRIVDPDGQARWVKDHTTIARNEEGQITHYLGYILDITSRVEAHEQLRVAQEQAHEDQLRLITERRAREAATLANEAKNRFLATMSHELRTPLNAIIGYSSLLTEMVEDDHWSPQELLKDLHNIQSSGQHLLALVNDILDLSKIESGHDELHPERFILADLCRETVAQLQPLAKRSNNTLQCKSRIPLTLELYTDRTKLKQILLNLLSNACKFTHGGQITLTAEQVQREDQAHWAFHVEDTGIGIAPEDIDRIFDAFVQVDASTTRRYEGTGLGLALCAKLTQTLGGELVVESQVGKGSRFSLYILEEQIAL